MGLSYAVLPNKFDPRYIRHLRICYESMAEYTMEKWWALTYFGNKENLENKKKCNIRFSKKDNDFFKAPYQDRSSILERVVLFIAWGIIQEEGAYCKR